MMDNIHEAAKFLKNSKYAVAFTGAGISVESGIPPFRGKTGLWSKYNPIVLDINYFHAKPLEAWKVINELFYDFFGKAKPNSAHFAIAEMEKSGIIKSVITQNIDNLHQEAGSKTVFEYHGTSQTMVCEKCAEKYLSKDVDLNTLPPFCKKCNSVLKPNFIFFGEGIPEPANRLSFEAAYNADVFLVVGTTGEIMPASLIPHRAKENGAKIIEINVENSSYTNSITDMFIEGKAGEVLPKLLDEILKI
ncbi:MAG: NAD-dependent deacylase [Bacteroidales bacterium]|nr:NAD-dependent deacylase [Bacteroidales bacterium]MBN2756644.1 NAD-dependent deacylase [Bacteroidales bacterium]